MPGGTGKKASVRPRNRGQTCRTCGWRSARLFVRTLAAGIHRPWPPRTGRYVRSRWAQLTALSAIHSRQGHPEDGYQRSVMCLAAWLITNAGAGLCIRIRRGNSLISATWPRFATPARGSAAGPVQGSTHWWDAIGSGVTHAGMRARARPRRAWAGWARWSFLNSSVLRCISAVRRPGPVVASTSGHSRSAERCRKDARSDSRQVPNPARVRD